MKKNIVYLMLASLLLFTGCANYLDQDPEDLNSMDKIFSSKIETTKWYNRIYSDDFMVQEMHYSGQIPYFWCTDESAYILESHVRNIAEGKMSPDNYYGYTGYNLYFFVRYYQAIRHCNLFLENVDKCAELGEIDRRQKELVEGLRSLLGLAAKVTLVAPKSIVRSEGKAVRVIDKRKI